ncbi:hypothetical protein U2J09_22660 [Serratia liquefaciens]|uniref:hypothetical protein n=1 Tax=Serratia liquefaciens TaxID=614 RepID=UPI0032DF2374
MKWITKYIFRGWGVVLTWGIACGTSAELPSWSSTSDIPTLAEPMNVPAPNDNGLTRTTLDVFTCSAGNMSENILRTRWRDTVEYLYPKNGPAAILSALHILMAPIVTMQRQYSENYCNGRRDGVYVGIWISIGEMNPTKVGTTYWAEQVQAEPVRCWITASNVDLGEFQPGTQSPAIAIPTTLVCDGDVDLSVTLQSLEGKEILTFSPGVTGLITVGRSSVSNTTKVSITRYVPVDPLASVRLTVLPGAKPGAYEAYGVIYVTVQ